MTSSVCNLGVLDSLSESSISEILERWSDFCLLTETIINNSGDDASMSSSLYSNFQACVSSLSKYGNGLRSLLEDHFLLSLQVYYVLLFIINSLVRLFNCLVLRVVVSCEKM